MNRRDFLKNTVKVIGGITLPLTAFKIINSRRPATRRR
jgi:hypothetical protein